MAVGDALVRLADESWHLGEEKSFTSPSLEPLELDELVYPFRLERSPGVQSGGHACVYGWPRRGNSRASAPRSSVSRLPRRAESQSRTSTDGWPNVRLARHPVPAHRFYMVFVVRCNARGMVSSRACLRVCIAARRQDVGEDEMVRRRLRRWRGFASFSRLVTSEFCTVQRRNAGQMGVPLGVRVRGRGRGQDGPPCSTHDAGAGPESQLAIL